MAVETKSVEIKLAIGSPTLTVNGTTSTIQKPYKQNGTTMVPLSVITKAFGAGLKLENNKIITLTYNKTTVVLTIGSKTVKVNGSPITLTAEPKIVNSVTMVPLRVIVSAFGATLALNGNDITIKGLMAAAPGTSTGTNTGGINSDAGKTYVGDSYYNWSMKYPSDFVMAYQSNNGMITQWASVADDRKVAIFIEDVDQAYSREELREFAEDYFGTDEFAVEKKTITVGDLSFEKIISKTRSGWYYEYRVIQVNDRIYMAATGVQATTKDKLDALQDILNSFKPSFAKNDLTLKDITKVKDGYVTTVDKDFGLTVNMPVNWTRLESAPNPIFVSEDGLMFFNISSLEDNDTAQAWEKRSREKLEQSFVSDYLRNVKDTTVALKDGEAQVLSYEYSFDKEKWHKQYQLFFVSGEHKYQLKFYYNEGVKVDGESIYNKIVSSIDIDTEYVDSNFSELEDSEALEQLTVKKSSKAYGYSIELPQSWMAESKDFEDTTVEYYTDYGDFMIDIWEDEKATDVVDYIKNYLTTDEDMKDAGAQVKSTTTATVGNGISATKLVVDFNKLTAPTTETYLIFEKNGITYVIYYTITQANNTDSNRAAVEKVIGSFTFTS